MAAKKLKNSEYALAVIEWLANLNAKSFCNYRFPIYYNLQHDHFQRHLIA